MKCCAGNPAQRPPGVVSRFHLEVLKALCLVIRPHPPAQCKRRRPGWTLPPKSSVDVALYSVLRNDLWALDKGLADLLAWVT